MLRDLVSKVVKRIRDEFFPADDGFDQVTGVRTDTAGITSLRRLRINSPNKSHGNRYQGIDPNLFTLGVQQIPEDLSAFSFIDVGCGKGRAVILAHQHRFAKLFGIEFSPALAAVAKKNVATLGIPAKIIDGDAAQYQFADEPTVVFFYNPFGEAVMSVVVEHLNAIKSPVYVIYIRPVCAELFSSFRTVSRQGDVLVLCNFAAVSKSKSASV